MRMIPAALVATLLSAVSLLAADLTLTQTSTDRGQEKEQTQLWSARFMRINQPGSQSDFLVDFTEGVSYRVDHQKKVIQKMSWDDLEVAAEASLEKLRKLPPLVLTLMGVNQVTVTVEERGSETFLGRECRKWKITVGPVVIETSNDPTIQPPMPTIPYQRFVRLHAAIGQWQPDAVMARKAGEELSKVQGIALNYRIALPLAGQMTMTTTRIEEGPIPPSAFDLPADYEVEDTGKKLREHLVAVVPSGSDHPVAARQVQSCSGI